MSGRNLNGLAGFQGRTLTGLSNIVSAEDEIVDIKNKIDFDTTVSNGNLLIGNSSGNYTSARLTAGTNISITNADGAITINSSDSDTDIKTKYDFDASVSNGNLLIGNSSGNYTSANLTAGSNITITNSSGGITIASSSTNFFQKSSNDISALNTTDNLLLGTTSNPNSRKLLVSGNLESSVSFSGAFVSDFGLTDSSLNIQISSSITGKLRIGAAATNRVVEIYNGGYLITFPTISGNDSLVLEDATQTLTNKTLTSPTIDIIKNGNNRNTILYDSSVSRIFLGNITDNIQAYNAFLVSPKIEDASANNYYNIVAPELTSNIDVSLPVLSSNDEFVFKDATQTLTNKTIFQPTIDAIKNSNSRFITQYSSAQQILFFGNTTDIIQAYKLEMITPKIYDTTADHTYNITVSELTANRNINLPVLGSDDEFVFKDATQTLTNKTITGTFTGNISGNADTATKLLTARTIGGVSFDGSANIDLAGVNTIGNQDTTGNAATSTKIATITNSNIVQLTESQTLTNKTIDAPVIDTIKNSNSRFTITYQSNTNSYIFGNLTDTTSAYNFQLATPKIFDTTADHTYNITVSELSANRNINLPILSSNDEFVFKDAAQTLTNKSISYSQLTGTPTIPTQFFQKSSSNISPLNTTDNFLIGTTSNTAPYKLSVVGTANISGKLTLESTINDLTLPTGSDTFCLLNAGQTLTSKTLTSPVIDTPNIRTSNTFNIVNIFSSIITFGNSTDLSDLLHIRKITAPSNENIIDCTGTNTIVIGNSTDSTTLTNSNFSNCTFPTFNQNTTGNAATATTLQNARTIGGVSFNGSANIDLAGVNTTGNQDTTGNAATATKISSITNSNIVQLNESQTLTLKTLTNVILNGTSFIVQDVSQNNNYVITPQELTSNHSLKLPVLTEDASEFIVSNTVQTMKNKTIQTTQGRNLISSDNEVTGIDIILVGNGLDTVQLGEGTFVGVGVTAPRAALDLARNYPNDTTSTSGEVTNIFLNVKNLTGGSSGLVWKPNFSGYSKTSAYINFEPTANFFRGELHFGANATADTSTAARKVMVIKQEGQLLYSNPITFSPVSTSNNWYPTCFWEGNVTPLGSTIGGGAINNGGAFRSYCWAVESTSNSFRALGLFANNTNSYSYSTGSNWTFMGFFQPFSKTTTYSFTASHRCYSNNTELYNEDKIGLIVESTGQYDSLYKNPIIDNSNTETDIIEEVILETDPATVDEVEINPTDHDTINNNTINNNTINNNTINTDTIDNSEKYNIDIDNAVPIVELCNSRKSKKVLGVIAKFESDGDRREGMDFGYIQVCDKDKNRLYINGIGEGAVWVCNSNGNFENGDYIQSSNIAGYGEKQDDDILHNYTLGKITMDIDFNNLPTGFKTRTLDNNIICILAGCIYVAG